MKPSNNYKKVKARRVITGSYGLTCPFCGERHWYILDKEELIGFVDKVIIRSCTYNEKKIFEIFELV